MRRTSTAAELRADIDRGLTGDKVPVEDPAAAPLGTDDEAAGTPPTPEIVGQAREQERQIGEQARRGSSSIGEAEAGGAIPWLLIGAFLTSLVGLVWLAIALIR